MTEQEYNRCVDQYADPLYRFILKNLGHAEDARDIVQNSFEILWVNHRTLETGKAKSWLFTVGYRNMIDHLRKRRRVSLTEALPESGVHEEPRYALRSVLERGLSRLGTVQRSLVLLKDYEGYSYEEIGKITGLNASQVKVYLHRARIALKQFMVSMENVL
ncbi:RNA polymerase sigma factor [Compostibacter hankyongensis]|uniref:Sigma-70 family RNA polymerase sigma factor n=1 Tax=Compostibacter hankyongensis TaxID=1007089 RepID=A0ABP8G4Y5_9BACT